MTTAEGIRKRNNSYHWYHSYTGADGKRVYFNGTEKSEPEAKKARRASMAKVDSGDLTEPSKLTMGELFDAWLPTTQVKPTTRKSYSDNIEHRLRPTLGNVKLAKLNAATIDTAYAKMRRRDGGELSSTSLQQAHRGAAPRPGVRRPQRAHLQEPGGSGREAEAPQGRDEHLG